MQKHVNSQEYEEINLVDYLRILKRQGRTIITITLVVTLVSFLVTVISPATTYESQAILEIGTIKNTPLANIQEVINELVREGNIQAKPQEGSSTNVVITANDSSPVKTEELLKEATKKVIQEHAILYEKQINLLNDQIQSDATELQSFSRYFFRFQQLLNRPGLADAYQVTFLQGYLLLRDRIAGIKENIDNLQLQKLASQKTALLGTIKTTQALSPKITVPLGILLGFVLAVLWVFIKEWWDKIKRQL